MTEPVPVAVLADGGVPSDQGAVTTQFLNAYPNFAVGSLVVLKANERVAYIKLGFRPYATGMKMHVNGSGMDLGEGIEVQGSLSLPGKGAWRLHKTWSTSDGKAAVGGLIVAVIGAVIKLSFDVPAGWVIFTWSAQEKAAWLTSAAVMGVVGTLIVFWRGVWRQHG